MKYLRYNTVIKTYFRSFYLGILFLIILLTVTCVNNQEIKDKIDKLKISELLTNENIYNLPPKNINNLDSLKGFRGLKLNMVDSIFDFSEWNCKQYSEFGLNIFEKRQFDDIQLNNSLLTYVRLVFYYNELKYFELKFVGKNVNGIEDILESAFGSPKNKHNVVDTSETGLKKALSGLYNSKPAPLPIIDKKDYYWQAAIINLHYHYYYYKNIDFGGKLEETSNVTLIYIYRDNSDLPELIEYLENKSNEEGGKEREMIKDKNNLNQL